jgi:hypothetical protein
LRPPPGQPGASSSPPLAADAAAHTGTSPSCGHRAATAAAAPVIADWRASNFPDCGSFRILSWKGPVNCQEKSRIIPRNSAMKPPAW